jgi:hypothetical protein
MSNVPLGVQVMAGSTEGSEDRGGRVAVLSQESTVNTRCALTTP